MRITHVVAVFKHSLAKKFSTAAKSGKSSVSMERQLTDIWRSPSNISKIRIS